jgi:acetyl-CoA carboxylase biotin carboxylase subunit
MKRVLIANRGEIALRIIRACHEEGLEAVAVYSAADRRSPHVRAADRAVAIGPAPPSESYLSIERLIAAARESGADAVHPGYGFLAERAAFAEAVEQAELIFVGPPPAAIRAMGDKNEARRRMQKAGVPIVPGGSAPVDDPAAALAAAAEIGYPVMVKAAAGGGGKGMRLVRSAEEMPAAFRDARSEAQNAFGNSEVYIERAIQNPRHIEIQVLGDRHGNMVHLGERECSIQRRHQKVAEESPSPIVDAAMRERMGEAAVRAARAAGYYNAGTVEFLVDAERNFYFLEMNTRLQVEHPVTECVTGLDLVKLQLRIAAGEPLPFRQEDILLRGAAIECRIYAEDPENSFFPCPGLIRSLDTPSGPGVRDDSGVYAGWTVPVEYDPLLSKLIAWGATREEAIGRMRRAMDEYHVGGIQTNLGLFRTILRFPDFLEGRLDTELIDRLLAHEAQWKIAPGEDLREALDPEVLEIDLLRAAALAAVLEDTKQNAYGTENAPPIPVSRWKAEGRRELLRKSSQQSKP